MWKRSSNGLRIAERSQAELRDSHRKTSGTYGRDTLRFFWWWDSVGTPRDEDGIIPRMMFRGAFLHMYASATTYTSYRRLHATQDTQAA